MGRIDFRAIIALVGVTLSLSSLGADVSSRKMVWAHYVPWYTPKLVGTVPGGVDCFVCKAVVLAK